MEIPKEIQDLLEKLPNSPTELVQVFQDRKSLKCQILEGTLNLLNVKDIAVIKTALKKYKENPQGKKPPKSWRVLEIKKWAYTYFPKVNDLETEDWKLAAFAIVGEFQHKGLESPSMAKLIEDLTNSMKLNGHSNVNI